MALVTNKPSKFVPEVLKKHQIDMFFAEIIGGDTFPDKKPNPMALNWLLEKYELQPEQMLMVGDSKNDILAAKNAGCLSFGLTYGYNHGEPISTQSPTLYLIALLICSMLLRFVRSCNKRSSKILVNEYTEYAAW